MSGLAWTDMFVVANLVQFLFGVAITGVSYHSYLSNGKKQSLRYSTIGFLCITVGGVLAPVYEFGIKSDYNITAQELLKLQIIEGTVIGIGLAFLLVSIFGYNTTTTYRDHLEYEVRDDEQQEQH